ncbi:Fic family protein [Streptomyces coeruleorubidus]|uniref:Fic family protein n=1 Tax=Streptomyces coeruleorubidus TaxID=116188 RepID=UPI00237F9EAC|nr:Fic family protein [Streptomyces coeruleorubidus]WDV52028.1 Fic family protein [Streptomyces coeruleorubidus]
MTGHLTVAEVGTIARIAFGGHDPEVGRPGCPSPPCTARAPACSARRAASEDPHEQAAALPHALATHHPLVDGNERTAGPAAATLFGVNGVDLTGCDRDTAYGLVIDVASADESDICLISERLLRL